MIKKEQKIDFQFYQQRSTILNSQNFVSPTFAATLLRLSWFCPPPTSPQSHSIALPCAVHFFAMSMPHFAPNSVWQIQAPLTWQHDLPTLLRANDFLEQQNRLITRSKNKKRENFLQTIHLT